MLIEGTKVLGAWLASDSMSQEKRRCARPGVGRRSTAFENLACSQEDRPGADRRGARAMTAAIEVTPSKERYRWPSCALEQRSKLLEHIGSGCGLLTMSLSGRPPIWIARHARTINPARMTRYFSSHGRSKRWLGGPC